LRSTWRCPTRSKRHRKRKATRQERNFYALRVGGGHNALVAACLLDDLDIDIDGIDLGDLDGIDLDLDGIDLDNIDGIDLDEIDGIVDLDLDLDGIDLGDIDGTDIDIDGIDIDIDDIDGIDIDLDGIDLDDIDGIVDIDLDDLHDLDGLDDLPPRQGFSPSEIHSACLDFTAGVRSFASVIRETTNERSHGC